MLKKFGEKKNENKNKKNMYVIGRLPLIGYSSFVVSFHFIFFFLWQTSNYLALQGNSVLSIELIA